MTLDTTLERRSAPMMARVVDAFETYLDDRIARDVSPEGFFREAGIAIQDVLYGRNGAVERFEPVPDAYVISLPAYLPEIAERVLSPCAAEEVARAYSEFFSER